QSEDPATVEGVAQRIADGVCGALGVSPLRVRIDGQRPHDRRGELHGLYLPANGSGRDRITLWIRPANVASVVPYRPVLRTHLTHLRHPLDSTYLPLRDSLHTQGFYQRESSLFAALGAWDAGAPEPRGRR